REREPHRHRPQPQPPPCPSHRHPVLRSRVVSAPNWVASRAMRAGDLIDRAEDTLIASPSVDHWQKGRERIEAEELLAFVLDGDPDPDDDVPASAARRFRR